MRLSKAGTELLILNEGVVKNAYRDRGHKGVITIGIGFTMRSKVFSEYWLKKKGHPLRMGDYLSASDARELLPRIAEEEYGAAVQRVLPSLQQHEYDVAVDMAYNCGPGSLSWKWAKALRNGDVQKAAALLRKTALTSGGVKMQGLVNRRERMARLLETGHYPDETAAVGLDKNARENDARKMLKALGYDIHVMKAAVVDFQADHGKGLVVDGIIGPATLTALQEATEANSVKKKTAVVATNTAIGIGFVGAIFGGKFTDMLATGIQWALLLAVGMMGAAAWRYRHNIKYLFSKGRKK